MLAKILDESYLNEQTQMDGKSTQEPDGEWTDDQAVGFALVVMSPVQVWFATR